ncbi:hypothetical protein [Candidatus Nitrosotenuis aquarius]|uniref:hypothetical protein n=1 Tax=Candidatus Nitrosotenuis aquarius TaxID=1846278 RepID=UPI000C1F7A65|nr:hypothetical protein [Candidatus Nitrosotenuis aquarius]
MAKKAAKRPAKEEKKKAKTTPAKKEKPAKKAKSKKPAPLADDGLVIIDEKFEEDKEAELEARKAYLEEARSQEVED